MTLTASIMDDAKPLALPATSGTNNARRESQATAIVRLAFESGVELWHTPSGDGYMTLVVSGHSEHHPLASRGTRDYLTRLYYLDTGRAPNPTALQAAIATLSGTARFDGDGHDVHVRVAGGDGCVYLDLVDSAWRAIEVTATGWRVMSTPPVRFRRSRGMLPLPLPVAGGSVDEFRPFVNVSDDDFLLLIAWVIGTLRPQQQSYAACVLDAEQGAGKTTIARMLRRLIDPNVAPTRSEPRESRDVAIAASNGHVVSLDNVSRLPGWLSDCLARLATGDGFSTRALYTDSEEIIFQAFRPVLLNGITAVPTRPDLLERALIIRVKAISDDARRPEDELWADFDAAAPRILGALLDSVSMALRQFGKKKVKPLPRMADFAKWVVAAEPACPWPEGAFLQAYATNRQGAVEATLDGDPVADLVRAIVPWSGTAKELLAELNDRTPDTITKRKDWFSLPRQVADALRRLVPSLRRIGVEVLFRRHGRARSRLIEIQNISASAASASSADPVFRAEGADASPGAQGHSSAGVSADPACVSRGVDAADAADAEMPPLSSGDGAVAGYDGGAGLDSLEVVLR